MKRHRLRVSDHAVVRYLERAGGFNIERLRREIAERVQAAVDAGASGVLIDGHRFIVREDAEGRPCVTTVLETDWPARNHTRTGRSDGGQA